MRKCPICIIPLDQRWVFGHEIDKCSACSGSFYDYGELGNIVTLVGIYRDIELGDEKEIETLPPPRLNLSDLREREDHLCPSDNTKMNREDFGGITADVCPSCKGVWLDKGELVHLKRTELHIQHHLELYRHLAE